jgi:AraC family ethanolamine operon transcriptional activator
MSHFELHTYSGFEPLQAFDVVYGGHFEHRLVSPKRATMVHQRLVMDGIRIETGAYDFPVIAQGAMPPGAVCVGMVADGIAATRYNTLPLDREAIQVYAPGAELLYHAAAASRWINFTAPVDRLQTLALARHGRPLSLPESGIVSLRVPSQRRAWLQRLVDDAFELVRALQPARLGSELEREIARALVQCYVDVLSTAGMDTRHGTVAGRRHYGLILACGRLALEAGTLDMDLAGLARRTGFSLRSLERIFRDGLGMTPGRWFRNIRLNRALRDLMWPEPECSVTGVATRWGFRHLSRFSGEYRKTFGELPSQTLARAQAKGASIN